MHYKVVIWGLDMSQEFLIHWYNGDILYNPRMRSYMITVILISQQAVNN